LMSLNDTPRESKTISHIISRGHSSLPSAFIVTVS
jgi:hypothetical protein